MKNPTILPGILLAVAALAAGHVDLLVADTWFYDGAAGGWIGAGTWWADDAIHGGGAWLVRLVGLAALALVAVGSRLPRLAGLRRGAAYVALSLVACTTLVAGLKQVTNVDCPRDLARYGGDRPYVRLLEDRPEHLPRGRCFPGSHSSSGFALMALYFALRGRSPGLARGLLAGSVLVGAVFSFGQQARGAHFLSHDLASAAIAWFVLLALHRWLLESRAPDGARLVFRPAHVPNMDGIPPRGPGLGKRPAAHPPHARRRRAGIRGVLQCVFRARLPVCAPAPEWGR